MDTIVERVWTTEGFLAWEDRQEFRHEFNGRRVIPMTGGSVAHQYIVGNLWVTLIRLLVGKPFTAILEMRLRIGARIRYPDVVVCAGPVDQTTRTLPDAVATFEVLSDDTATTDRVDKLIEYAEVPSLRAYVLLEQTAMAATLFQRRTAGEWVATADTSGNLVLPGLEIELPLDEVYRGLTFLAQ